MKKINSIFYLVLAISIVLSACSIEKRHYNPGYHITWKNGKQSSGSNEYEASKVTTAESVENIASVQSSTVNQDDRVTSVESETLLSSIKHENTPSPSISSENHTLFSGLRETKKVESNKNTRPSFKETIIKQGIKKATKSSQKDDVELILLVILCFILPPIAVGLKTDWDTKTVLISLILTILCFVPGIIHALIVVLD